ncbi:MAG: 30S ribosomal protein S1 [Lachnospiraceae bacterium]
MSEANTNEQINAESMEDFKDELEASFRKIKVGDLLSGTVIDVNENGVTLDLKYFAPGIIPANEFSDAPDFSVLDAVKIGEELEATVISTDDGDGNLLLSRKDATKQLAWEKLQGDFIEQRTLELKVQGIVSGGIIVYPEGIRGFIPASQLGLSYVQDLNEWLGKTVRARIITLDPSANKLVLSNRVIEKEAQEDARNHQISMLIPGSILEGTVDSLMPYGAFIDLGNGLSGLVHISQISEKRIQKPGEVLSIGQKVKVKLLNTNNGKISLSIRALEEEMVDTSTENAFADAKPYLSEEHAGTNLGDLLSKFKLS